MSSSGGNPFNVIGQAFMNQQQQGYNQFNVNKNFHPNYNPNMQQQGYGGGNYQNNNFGNNSYGPNQFNPNQNQFQPNQNQQYPPNYNNNQPPPGFGGNVNPFDFLRKS